MVPSWIASTLEFFIWSVSKALKKYGIPSKKKEIVSLSFFKSRLMTLSDFGFSVELFL